MRVWRLPPAMWLGISLLSGTARAAVDIRVDLSSQTMQVSSSNGERYLWPVSTARKGFRTPRGTYGVQSMAKLHFSRKYQNSPMPHSIFFNGSYAIHGSSATRSLGRTASHGCIRLSPRNAATLYAMVEAEGARITILGSAPHETAVANSEGRRRRRDDAMEAEPFDSDLLVRGLPEPSFDAWTPNPDQDPY